MYKSETCSTESATDASSSQHLEIERTYTSSDTSTKVVKKKKTSIKALVKRLLGVLADLSSKMQSTPKVKKISKTRKKKIVESPEKANEDIVNAETSDVSNHLLLDSIYAASMMSFWIEWSMISSKLITKHRLHMLPLDIDFWSRLLAVTHQGWLISSVTFI
ncbi:unnamed protein product [Lactuca virosa]|uniref:Uncharacterized protein n=1 Tax=Lactuca virosa TaxID=75947 RepID=A0AAU9MFL3_9ASTR|nr:unnamed protein product [Lactuca virosa]